MTACRPDARRDASVRRVGGGLRDVPQHVQRHAVQGVGVGHPAECRLFDVGAGERVVLDVGAEHRAVLDLSVPDALAPRSGFWTWPSTMSDERTVFAA